MDVYPKVSVIQNEVKDPALGLSRILCEILRCALNDIIAIKSYLGEHLYYLQDK